jgi:hypothetical protein
VRALGHRSLDLYGGIGHKTRAQYTIPAPDPTNAGLRPRPPGREAFSLAMTVSVADRDNGMQAIGTPYPSWTQARVPNSGMEPQNSGLPGRTGVRVVQRKFRIVTRLRQSSAWCTPVISISAKFAHVGEPPDHRVGGHSRRNKMDASALSLGCPRKRGSTCSRDAVPDAQSVGILPRGPSGFFVRCEGPVFGGGQPEPSISRMLRLPILGLADDDIRLVSYSVLRDK